MPGPAYYSAVINIAQNEDWIVPFIYSAVDSGGVSTPIDLTGSTLLLEIRVRESDVGVLLSLSSPDDGIVITDAVNGAFTITMDRDDLMQQPSAGELCERSFAADAKRLSGTHPRLHRVGRRGDDPLRAMTAIKSWFKDNQTLVYFLIAQAIAIGAAVLSMTAYMVRLETRVSTLEVRGSPHLACDRQPADGAGSSDQGQQGQH